jgi:3-deoxy-D-manno-octulosonic acid kinase
MGFLRIYRRGGAMRHVVRETYLLENRALAEFRVHHYLEQAGFPVPRLLGVTWRTVGPFVRGAIATHALTGQNLIAAYRSGNIPSPDTLAACGAVIHRLHASRVYHADLNASNLFLTPDGVYLLDFDRATHADKPLTPAARQRNLARMHRSMLKNYLPEGAFRCIRAAYEAAK